MSSTRWALAILVVFALCAIPAMADTITYVIGTGNAAIGSYAGPYGQATVTLTNSTTATITFTSFTNNGNIYLMGDGGTVAVNVNASSFTVSNIFGSNSGTGFTPGPYSNGGAGNEDGFGSFNLTINSFDGYTHSSDTVTFTITNNSGTWANAGAVLIGNADGWLVAEHVFVTADPANASNSAKATGYATGNSAVPEPASLALFGGGLLGLGGIVRRQHLGPA